MYSKTPRTAVGEFVNASFTQKTKKNHVQSRVKTDNEIPRSPSFFPTPRKTAVTTRLTKSPGRALNSSRGGILTTNKQNSPWSQQRVASASKLPRRHFYDEGRTKNEDNFVKSPVNQYKELIASLTKPAPRHAIKHDRVSSLRSTPRMNLSLPAEEITPGTMVAAFLDSKDSTIPVVRRRARTSQTGLSMPAQLKDVKQTVVKARRRSIGESEKETPRALIKNFLLNMNSAQTPAIVSHRVQTKKYDSPDMVVPSQSSYHTPSPFKSSSSERSHEGATGLSVQRKGRRTPRPHAPFHFDVPGPVSAETDSPRIVQNVPKDVRTPSPFKLLTSDVSSPSVKITMYDRSQRYSARRPHKGTFLLDIPEHMLERGDNSNPRGAEESMDSTKAQYSFDLQSSREAHDSQYAEDKENIEDDQELTGAGEERDEFIDEEGENENIDYPVNAESQERQGSNLQRLEKSRDHIETEETFTRQKADYSRNREGSHHDSLVENRSHFQRSNKTREFVEETLGSQYDNNTTMTRQRSQYESPRLRSSNSQRSIITSEFVEGTKYDNSIHRQRSLHHSPRVNSSNYERTRRSREFVEDIQRSQYENNVERPRSETKRFSDFQRSNQNREFVEETRYNDNVTRQRSLHESSGSNRNWSLQTSTLPDLRVEETRGLNQADGDYDEADDRDYDQSPSQSADVYDEVNGNYDEVGNIEDREARGGYDEAHEGYDEADGSYDEMEQDGLGVPSVRPADNSRKSGMNLSRAVPENFVPEFTSTQQPAQTRHNDSDANIEEDEDDHQEVEQDENMEDEQNLPAESVTQVKPKQLRKPRKKQIYSLPVSMVKKSFMRVSDRRLSKEALEEVMKISETYWDNLCADLKAYANHAGRKTVTMDDFVLLFKRQGHINTKVSLNALITQHLCMEDRRRLIPVARAGNRIELWK